MSEDAEAPLTWGRGTYRPTAGTVNSARRFSMPLFMTRCHQIDLPTYKLNTELYIFCCTGRQKNAPNCTDLHLYFQKFSGGDSTDPHNCKSPPPYTSLSARIHRPTFQISATAELMTSNVGYTARDNRLVTEAVLCQCGR